MKRNKIDVYMGTGKITSTGRLSVTAEDKTTNLQAKHIIVATGARARDLPFAPSDGKRIWTYLLPTPLDVWFGPTFMASRQNAKNGVISKPGFSGPARQFVKKLAALQELRGQLPGLGIAPLAPVNRARLRQLAHRVHPIGHGAAQLGQRSQLSCGSSHSVAPLLLVMLRKPPSVSRAAPRP